VVLKDNTSLSAEQLREYCKSKLAPHKIPRVVKFVDMLPVTGSGKVKKYQLVSLAD